MEDSKVDMLRCEAWCDWLGDFFPLYKAAFEAPPHLEDISYEFYESYLTRILSTDEAIVLGFRDASRPIGLFVAVPLPQHYGDHAYGSGPNADEKRRAAANLKTLLGADFERHFHEIDCVIAPHAQGQGLGREVLRAGTSEIPRRYVGVTGVVDVDNTRMQRLLHSEGWTNMDVRRRIYSGGHVREKLFVRKALP